MSSSVQSLAKLKICCLIFILSHLINMILFQAMDIINCILEGYPKSKKQLLVRSLFQTNIFSVQRQYINLWWLKWHISAILMSNTCKIFLNTLSGAKSHRIFKSGWAVSCIKGHILRSNVYNYLRPWYLTVKTEDVNGGRRKYYSDLKAAASWMFIFQKARRVRTINPTCRKSKFSLACACPYVKELILWSTINSEGGYYFRSSYNIKNCTNHHRRENSIHKTERLQLLKCSFFKFRDLL